MNDVPLLLYLGFFLNATIPAIAFAKYLTLTLTINFDQKHELE